MPVWTQTRNPITNRDWWSLTHEGLDLFVTTNEVGVPGWEAGETSRGEYLFVASELSESIELAKAASLAFATRRAARLNEATDRIRAAMLQHKTKRRR